MAIDMYDGVRKLGEALSGLSDDEIRKSILMYLISVGKDDLLVDPVGIEFASIKSVGLPLEEVVGTV